jgi:signal transduction histidine kinase
VHAEEPLLVAHGMDLQRTIDPWQTVRHASRAESLASVCRGEADAALIDRMALEKTLLERPSPCGLLPLKVSQTRDLPVRLAILSNRHKATVADKLRAAIGEMEHDGELAAAALRYPQIISASGRHVASLVQDRSRTSALRVTVTVLSVLLCLCGWLIYRLRRYVGQLSRTAAELKRAYQDLAQFAYASHHDLREPLRNMRLFSQMLQRRGLDDPRAPEHLSYIVDGAERMSSMLDAVRAYTQIAPQTEERPINPAEALQDALQKLESEIESSGAEVRAARMPPVRFDRAHLVAVFFNLIDNALKYRKEDKPLISVEAAESNGSVQFSVCDNGEGIAPEYQQKVFGVFKRLHGRNVAGTGIGLAICRKIVENHHGRIWIESAPGVGTTVHFTVPRVGRRRSRAAKLLPWLRQR